MFLLKLWFLNQEMSHFNGFKNEIPHGDPLLSLSVSWSCMVRIRQNILCKISIFIITRKNFKNFKSYLVSQWKMKNISHLKPNTKKVLRHLVNISVNFRIVQLFGNSSTTIIQPNVDHWITWFIDSTVPVGQKEFWIFCLLLFAQIPWGCFSY